MIELNHVNVAYDNGRPVLKDVTLKILANELLIVVGKSGSGKSTLLKVMNGLLPPQSGSYFFQGVDVYTLSDTKRKQACTQKIGFVWQDYRLISEISVENNILLPTLITGVNCDSDFLSQLLDMLEIKKY
ncbi:MAG: ATP-binding cassette domain-containing protein, partial [Prevotellaceae bacterium]|nr:ATP-binding cassette domain-containing protein [Prevotellaceae bacterium]